MLPRLGAGCCGLIALPVRSIPGGARIAPGPGFGLAEATMLVKKHPEPKLEAFRSSGLIARCSSSGDA